MVELAKLNANTELTREQAREKRDKELRQAHNLQKMYKAEAFNE